MNISGCYVCTHLPTYTENSMSDNVLPFSKYVGCVLMRDMLFRQHNMSIAVATPRKGQIATGQATAMPKAKRVPCMNMQPTKRDQATLDTFDRASRNEEWKERAGWENIEKTKGSELKIPRFRIRQQLTAPS